MSFGFSCAREDGWHGGRLPWPRWRFALASACLRGPAGLSLSPPPLRRAQARLARREGPGADRMEPTEDEATQEGKARSPPIAGNREAQFWRFPVWRRRVRWRQVAVAAEVCVIRPAMPAPPGEVAAQALIAALGATVKRPQYRSVLRRVRCSEGAGHGCVGGRSREVGKAAPESEGGRPNIGAGIGALEKARLWTKVGASGAIRRPILSPRRRMVPVGPVFV